jgi:hypothetical protein
MKRQLSVASLVLLVCAVFVQQAYVQIQSNPVKEPASDKAIKEDDRYIWIDGVKYSKGGMVLIEFGTDGTLDEHTLCIPTIRNMRLGIIRIEMQDGSVQNIDQRKIKRIMLD